MMMRTSSGERLRRRWSTVVKLMHQEQGEIAVGDYYDRDAPRLDYSAVSVARKDDGSKAPVVLSRKSSGFSLKLDQQRGHQAPLF